MENINQSPANKDVQTTELIKTMDFADAMREIINGNKISKLEWGDIADYGFMNDSFLSLHKSDGKNYKWIVNSGDLMGEDWFVI